MSARSSEGFIEGGRKRLLDANRQNISKTGQTFSQTDVLSETGGRHYGAMATFGTSEQGIAAIEYGYGLIDENEASERIGGTGLLQLGMAKMTQKAQTQVRTQAEQTMVNNLVKARQSAGKAQNGDATFAQGRTPGGRLTPVRESATEGASGSRTSTVGHGEPQVQADLPYGRGTIAVDQFPCESCAEGTLPNRVIVPRNPANPLQSPKSAAVGAANGKNTVVPRVVNEGPPTTQIPLPPPATPPGKKE